MNKSVIWIVILLALGLLAFIYFRDKDVDEVNRGLEEESSLEEADSTEEVEEEADSGEIDRTETGRRLETAVVVVPDLDVEVVLSSGEASFDAGGIVPTEGLVVLGDAFTAIEVEGQLYVLAHVSFNTGGTGVFDYLVSFRDTGAELEQTDAVLLGDSVVVETVEAGAGTTATVDILTRGEDESLSATPTVEQTLEFTVGAEGELVAA